MGSAAVHWSLQGEHQVPADDDWLTPRESAVLDHLRLPKRRRDWRLGRWTAKRAVAAYLGATAEAGRALSPARIAILAREDGSPEVWLDGARAPLDLSLSHAGGVALCALGDCGLQLGCDTEMVEDRSEAFSADFFTAEEAALVGGVPAATRAWLGTLLWSAKESGLKALRDGLRRDTRSVVVDFDLELATERFAAHDGPLSWAPLSVVCLDDGRRFRGWWGALSGRVLTLVALPPAELPERLDLGP